MIHTAEYGSASAQIQAYSDLTTWFSLTESNCACQAGDIQKNACTKRGSPYSVYSYNQLADWPHVYIIFFVLFYYLRPGWPHIFCTDYLPARRGSSIPHCQTATSGWVILTKKVRLIRAQIVKKYKKYNIDVRSIRQLIVWIYTVRWA